MMLRLVAACFTTILVAACMATSPALRWKNDVTFEQPRPPVLTVNSYPRTPPPEQATPLDRAEAAKIAEIGKKTKTVEEFAKAVAPQDTPRILRPDWTRLDRTVAISVQRPTYRPADSYLKYIVRVRPVDFVFIDYKAIGTVYRNVDLGQIVSGSSATNAAKLSPTISGTLVGAGEISTSLTTSEQFTRKVERDVQDPSILALPLELGVLREGAADRDLSGTTVVDLSVVPVVGDAIRYSQIVSGLNLRSGEMDLNPAAATMTIATVKHLVAKPVEVCAMIDYYEAVIDDASAKNIDPARQVIKEIVHRKSSWSPFIIAQPSDVTPPRWGLVDDQHHYVEMNQGGRPNPIAFADPLEADDFLYWATLKNAKTVGEIGLQTSTGLSPNWSKVEVSPIEIPETLSTPSQHAKAVCSALEQNQRVGMPETDASFDDH